MKTLYLLIQHFNAHAANRRNHEIKQKSIFLTAVFCCNLYFSPMTTRIQTFLRPSKIRLCYLHPNKTSWNLVRMISIKDEQNLLKEQRLTILNAVFLLQQKRPHRLKFHLDL